MWEAATGETKQKPLEVSGRPERLAWLGLWLVTGGADGLVRIHQTSDRQVLFTLYGHSDSITALAVAPSGSTLASGSYDGTVCVWNFACGTWSQRFIASPR
jgi:WD40 repeat protein